MLILGIETSCDETSISVVSDGSKVLSNIISSSLHLHRRYGGVVPEIACRHHTELINIVLEKSLKQAKVKLSEIDAIAVTYGPGLVGALLVGISLAKSLSFALGIPLIPVNHLHAHLYSAAMNSSGAHGKEAGTKITFPCIGFVISGGHSSLVYMKEMKQIELLGQTRDDACGEAYDKVAKILGLGFPGGPVIEKRAEKGDPKAIRFPRAKLGKDSLDFSFSGIKTAVLYHVQELKKKNKRIPIDDICASFQEAMLDMLLKQAMACCKIKNFKSLLVGGGVTANKALRKRLLDMAKSENLDVHFPGRGMSTDNGAMIAGLGFELYNDKMSTDYSLTAKPGLGLG